MRLPLLNVSPIQTYASKLTIVRAKKHRIQDVAMAQKLMNAKMEQVLDLVQYLYQVVRQHVFNLIIKLRYHNCEEIK